MFKIKENGRTVNVHDLLPGEAGYRSDGTLWFRPSVDVSNVFVTGVYTTSGITYVTHYTRTEVSRFELRRCDVMFEVEFK